jgi:hypothetical protein
MSRNLIVYKVDYRKKSDPYGDARFIKTTRIKMTPDEVNQKGGYWRNHSEVEKKFFKIYENLENTTYSGNKYRITRVRKA